METLRNTSTARLCIGALLLIVLVQFALLYQFSQVERIPSEDLDRDIPVVDDALAARNGDGALDSQLQSTAHTRSPASQSAMPREPRKRVHKPSIVQETRRSPTCTVTGKEALSALSRAQTESCRAQLRDIACAHESKTLYWTNFSRACPVPDNPATDLNFTLRPIPPGVPRVRILFMLTVHGRAVRQVLRLLKTLYHKDHFYFIHVDSRSNYMFHEISRHVDGLPNVKVTEWRMATIWGGASLLQMLLRAISEALALKEWHWDYFINLSESDYIIKPLPQLVDFLTVWRNKNFLRGHGIISPRFTKKQGLDQTFYECETHMWRLGKRELPDGIFIDGGSDWIIITRHYANYLTTSSDPVVLGVKHLFRFTLLPAEAFFHTLLRNSIHCQTYVKHNLKLTNWKRKLGCRCQYRHVVDWCGCSPNNYLPEDFSRLHNTKDRFFARKFEPVVNMAIINMLDLTLFGHWPLGTPALTSYWENIYKRDDGGESYKDATRSTFLGLVRRMSLLVQSCLPSDTKSELREVTILRIKDVFDSLLPRAAFTLGDGTELDIEGRFTSVGRTTLHHSAGSPTARVKSIDLGTDWDKKEYVYRNYASIFDVQSELVVTLRLETGHPISVIVTLYNPLDKAAFTHSFILEGHWVISEVNIQVPRPMRPGMYRMTFSAAGDNFATVRFAIIPRIVDSGKLITDFDTFRRANGDVSFPEEVHGNTIAERLQNWASSIVDQTWNFAALCSAQRHHNCKAVEICKHTTWSSLSPDPKHSLDALKLKKHSP